MCSTKALLPWDWVEQEITNNKTLQGPGAPENLRKDGFMAGVGASMLKLERTAGDRLHLLRFTDEKTKPEEGNLQKLTLPS